MKHVGAKYYNLYFKLVDFALKSKNATAVVTSSTFPEARYSDYQYVDNPILMISEYHFHQSGRLHAKIHVAQLLPSKRNRSDHCRTHSIKGSLYPRKRRKSCSPLVHLIFPSWRI